MNKKPSGNYYKVRYETHPIETKIVISQLESENNKLRMALEAICRFDLKPYENEYFYGSDKLKMIAYEALK